MLMTDRKTTEVIKVQVTQWSQFPDVDKVPKFSDTDIECLREVREVLKKYGQLDRFGISLLHKHFEIANDEFLLETTDVKERTQSIRPVKAKDYLARDDLSVMATSINLKTAITPLRSASNEVIFVAQAS